MSRAKAAFPLPCLCPSPLGEGSQGGRARSPPQSHPQRAIHPPGPGLHYMFPAKIISVMTSITVVNFGGTWRGGIHQLGSITMVPRERYLLANFIIYPGVTRGWPTRWCLFGAWAVQGDWGPPRGGAQGLLSSPLPGETGAAPPQHVSMS